MSLSQTSLRNSRLKYSTTNLTSQSEHVPRGMPEYWSQRYPNHLLPCLAITVHPDARAKLLGWSLFLYFFNPHIQFISPPCWSYTEDFPNPPFPTLFTATLAWTTTAPELISLPAWSFKSITQITPLACLKLSITSIVHAVKLLPSAYKTRYDSRPLFHLLSLLSFSTPSLFLTVLQPHWPQIHFFQQAKLFCLPISALKCFL